MRSQIFIGSSAEGLRYVDQICTYLEPVGDVVKWTTSFTQNRSALDSLIKKTKLSEFAILVATCDDLTLKRDDIKSTPRDNIVFEFGLFAGATGIDRAFLLVEEAAELPSDLEGIVVSRFSDDKSKYNSLEKKCAELIEHIRKEQETSQLGLLPSTALALGYYHSFIKGVCEQIRDAGIISVDNQTLKIKNFELYIIIPAELDNNGVVDFRHQYNKAKGLEQAQTLAAANTHRGYPFHFKIDPSEQDRTKEVEVKLFDIPTTLNTIVEAVKIFVPTEKIGQNSEHEYLENRELKNFAKVLKYLVKKNSLTRSLVIVSDNVVL
ncbi:hypothetical protein F0919_08045 [Taibaiella lutea]|uniref:CD-NTase-associated protein 12 n=1 Tax=Taibaiella lutea TaxID=2608001 RepID=A0A5M6CHS8_9BACT|nr:STING domain-containing protein [Taibaiella lutea]KAA5534563.1 hypothetical protein F0919_08045 [Taibaiella lutea]